MGMAMYSRMVRWRGHLPGNAVWKGIQGWEGGFAVTSYLHGIVYTSHRYAKKQGHNGAQDESWYLPDLFDGPRGEKKENGMSSNDVVLVVWRG